MLTLQNISYTHPNKDLLFSDINLTVNNHEKTALIGNNGVGKSTLLKIIAKELQPSNGQISVEAEPYYIPQIFGQFNHLTIAQALRIENKLNALKEILDGNTSEENFNLLNDDWTIEDRCTEALNYWQLNELDLSQKNGSVEWRTKNKNFPCRNFHSSTRIDFVGRAEQSLRHHEPTTFIRLRSEHKKHFNNREPRQKIT